MKIKLLILLVLLLTFSFFIASCRHTDDEEQIVQGITEEEIAALRLVTYAEHMNFGINVYTDTFMLAVNLEEVIDVYSFGFVSDFEELTDAPDDIIFFFPTEMTLGVLEGLNKFLSESDFDLSEFNLSYPLTLDDLVYNWEDVSDLWHDGTNRGVRDDIRSSRDSNFEIYQSRMLAELNLTQEDLHLRQLLLLGQGLHFEHNLDLRFMDIRRELESGSHRYTDVVFVRSSEEADSFSDGVIAFWPTDASTDAVESLNRHIGRHNIEVRDFTLEAPVTIEDVIVRTENVLELWQSIGANLRTSVSILTLPVRELST